jgi:hypothetical protein
MLLSESALREAEPINSVELYLSECSKSADDAARDAKALVKLVSRAQKALLSGDLAAISKAIAEIRPCTQAIDESLEKLSSFRSKEVEEAFRDERYFREIVDLARRDGFGGVRSTEGRLFSYPYVIERKKAAPVLSLGSKAVKNIRPSAVLKSLMETRKAGSRFDHGKLLEAVETIYDVRRRGQETDLVPIDEIYRLFTIMPGSEKGYAFLEFLATLDAIKRSGTATVKSARLLDLPPPSTTGKSGKAFVIVREDGREQLYHMLRFVSRG